MPFNLLTDPMIPVVSADTGREEFTLPALFSLFASGVDVQMVGARPHQEFLLHSTFVQLAVGALDRGGYAQIPTDVDTWLDLLRDLSPIETWDVLQADPTIAGFMQPPMDTKTFEAIRSDKSIEDPLRMSRLVISKSHVEKSQAYSRPTPWEWVVALIAAQTSLGYSGVGNFGILRMNSGQGSRPFAALYPSTSHCDMWRRDVSWLLANLQNIKSDYPIYSEDDGIVALWAVPWDGVSQVTTKMLHPLFVDVARRYRIVEENGRLQAVFANSSTTRIADEKNDDGLRGRTGDPWAPLSKGGASVLTVQSVGWTYRLVADLLFQRVENRPSPLLADTDVASETCVALFSVLVGGQGKTGGYHQREIEFPVTVARDYFDRSKTTRLTLADHSRVMIEEASAVSSFMRTAAAALGSGNFDFSKINWKSPPVERAVEMATDLFDRKVDEDFFGCLFDRYETGDGTSWNKHLKEVCQSILIQLSERLTLPNGIKGRALPAGENALLSLWKTPAEIAATPTKPKKEKKEKKA